MAFGRDRINNPDPFKIPTKVISVPQTQIDDPANSYSVIKYSMDFPSGGDLSSVKTYNSKGDHIYIAKCSGSSFYIKLNRDTNDWIKIKAGLLIKRNFNKIYVGCFDALGFNPGFVGTQVVLYISQGEFVKEEFRNGLRTPLLMRSTGLATTTIQTIWAALGVETNATSFGSQGGTIIIKNTDVANTLYITCMNTATVTESFPLLAGESVTLDVEDQISSGTSRLALIGYQSNLSVLTSSGTCSFAVICGPWQNDTIASSFPNGNGL